MDSTEVQGAMSALDQQLGRVLGSVVGGNVTPDLTQLNESLKTFNEVVNRRLNTRIELRDLRANRAYATSQLPVLSTDRTVIASEAERAVLLAAYTEACAAWRMLTDVRF